MVSAAIGKLVRKRQKGRKCSVKGCKDCCYVHDLCRKHGIALRRYRNVGGAKAGHRKGICCCGKEFVLIKIDQKYCSDKCYRNTPEYKKVAYENTKKYRESNKDKSRARDVVSKSINREKSMIRGKCEVCGTAESDAHHVNYKDTRNVVFLCRTHHHELHSWDSN